MRIVRRRLRSRRGFSLLEALIAAAFLGISLVALARLHVSSLKGTAKSDDISRAAEVARGIADTFATLPFASIPNCPPGRTNLPGWVNPPAANGCNPTMGATQQWAAPKGACTAWYDFDGVPDPGNAAWLANPMAGDGSAPDTGNFRVDLAVSAHPNPASYPIFGATNPGEDAVQVLWVWVCWRDGDNIIHEVAATRVMTQGL